jgi:hypothetical protein
MGDLALSQRQAGLKEQTGESFFRRIGGTALQSRHRLRNVSGLAGGRADAGRVDRDGEADSRIGGFLGSQAAGTEPLDNLVGRDRLANHGLGLKKGASGQR